MNSFVIEDLPLSDLKLIRRSKKSDSRGFLSRLYCTKELTSAGWDKSIDQINQTLTKKKGTLRGMHYQNPPHAESKLVTCIKGEVWDVVVDLRKSSKTFLKCHAEILSEKNINSLLVPEGFAHGFQALTPDCMMIYLHSEAYNPSSESGINYSDPILNINWPLEISEISQRDQNHNFLNKDFLGI